ncbi:12777_t:CDS:2, partial [Funneliformis geosporum]
AFDELIKKIIRPNLQANKVVIIDRYIDSTFVYQGLTGNIKIASIQKIAQKTINLPLPDITFILDIDPIQAQARLNKRKSETGEIYIIDASQSEAAVAEEVGKIIQQICKIEAKETPLQAAKREVFEETNLVLERYFYRANQYSGQIQIKEIGKILAIKFKKLAIMNKKPLLISIEGIDGSGKTSLLAKLKQKFPNSFTTQSPRGTELVTENLVSRQLITNVWTEFFLFTANHNEHALTVIKPNLATGKTVLIDRYIDSTFVYQGIRDIDPAKTELRIRQRRQETGEEPNNWDKANYDFHRKIRNGYLQLKEYFPQRIKIINADRSWEEIITEINQIISQY